MSILIFLVLGIACIITNNGWLWTLFAAYVFLIMPNLIKDHPEDEHPDRYNERELQKVIARGEWWRSS